MKERVQLLPYLTFDGKCQEAMEFYKGIFGGELEMNYFRDMHADLPEADKDKVMHAELDNDFLSLFASDTVPGVSTNFGDNVRVCLSGTDGARLAGFFEKLSQGATVTMPYAKQPWGQELGMLTDKFGTLWMVAVRG